MDDEEVLLAVQQFVRSQGEGQFEKVLTALTLNLMEQQA
jgi:hypothetical protein